MEPSDPRLPEREEGGTYAGFREEQGRVRKKRFEIDRVTRGGWRMKKGSAGGGRDPKVGENKDRSGDRPSVHEGASAAVSIKSVSKTLSDTVSGGSKEAAHGPTRTAIFVELEKTGRTLEREAKRVKNWGARRTRRMQPEPGRDGKAGGCLRKMRKFSKRDDWLLLGWEARHGDLGGAVNHRGCAL